MQLRLDSSSFQNVNVGCCAAGNVSAAHLESMLRRTTTLDKELNQNSQAFHYGRGEY